MRTEAQQLAEEAANESEVWRIRVVDLFYASCETDILPGAVNERRQMGLAAAAYFEQRGDWAAFSEALDG